MNKQELVEIVASSTGLSKTDVDRAIKATLSSISNSLAKGEKVTLVGFGTFERRQRKARTGVNPQNPEQKIKIPAKKAPVFSAGSELKAAVSTGKVIQVSPIKKGSSTRLKSRQQRKKKGR